MASESLGDAVLSIRTDVAQFNEKLNDVSKRLDGLKSGFKQTGDTARGFGQDATVLQGSLSGLFTTITGGVAAGTLLADGLKKAFGAVTQFVGTSVKAAGEAEKAHVQLVAALRAQGTAIPSVISAYNGYATALQRTTVFQDDAIESAAAMLVQVGNVMPRDMKAALEATTNLASGLGIDLNTAVLQVSKAAEGNTAALKKAGVQIDDTALKAHGFGAVLDAVNAKFGGQAAALASTYEGRLQQLGNTWNNVEESIGRVITQNATVLKFFDSINKAVDGNTHELKDNAAATELVSGALILLVRTGSALAPFLQAAVFGFGLLGTTFFAVYRTAINLTAATDELFIATLKGLQAASLGHLDLSKQITFFRGDLDKLQNKYNAVVQAGGAVWDATKAISSGMGHAGEFADKLAAELENTRGKTVALADAADGSADAWDRHTTAVNKSKDAVAKLAAEALGMTNKAGALMLSLRAAEGAFGLPELPSRSFNNMGNNRVPVVGPIPGGFHFGGALSGPDAHGLTIPDINAAARANMEAASRGSIFGGLSTAIPQAVISAVQGGGSVAQAVAGTAGANIGTNLVKNFGTSITNTLGKTFGGAINAVLPGLGALAAPLIGFIGKLFGKSEETSKVSPLRNEFFKLQGGLETLNPKVLQLTGSLKQVEAVFKAKTVEEYNAAIKDLEETLNRPAAALQTLNETAQRYKFTLEELGPALERQNLDEQAQQLYKDWRVLNAGQLDTVAINEHMSESVNDYLHNALKAGMEIPIAMKPMLEAMAQQGVLTDAAGNKIDDLGTAGISFSMTMSEGFKSLIDEVKKLTNAIAVGLGLAISNIPDVDVNLNVNEHRTTKVDPSSIQNDGFDVPEVAQQGAYVQPWGLQYLKRGGLAAMLASSLFIPRGTDTVPAMLTPGEGIVNTLGMRNLGMAGLRALNQGESVGKVVGGTDTSRIENELVAIRQDLGARLEAVESAVLANRQTSVQINGREIVRATVDTVDQNPGGLRTQLRDVLGVG